MAKDKKPAAKKAKDKKPAAKKAENLGGGMTKEKLLKTATAYVSLKAVADEVRGEMGPLLKDFEEQGGHKWALKTALKIINMESTKQQDAIRCLGLYLEIFGVADQGDMFDANAGKIPAPPEVPADQEAFIH